MAAVHVEFSSQALEPLPVEADGWESSAGSEAGAVIGVYGPSKVRTRSYVFALMETARAHLMHRARRVVARGTTPVASHHASALGRSSIASRTSVNGTPARSLTVVTSASDSAQKIQMARPLAGMRKPPR